MSETLTLETKARIDQLSYLQLLRLWREAPAGHWMFHGEAGDYASERLKELRAAGADHVGASKAIGWDR